MGQDESVSAHQMSGLYGGLPWNEGTHGFLAMMLMYFLPFPRREVDCPST